MSRSHFPLLADSGDESTGIVYLDNAATTQKPGVVIDAISNYYRTMNANVHRAAHGLAEKATSAFEASRETCRAFINAAGTEEVIFTSGTTASINLVAAILRSRLQADQEILISRMEHHSNIVPWQMLAAATGARLIACDVTPAGELDLDDFRTRLSTRTAVVAIGHVSNALGTINPVEEIVRLAHAQGALVLLDGAQATAHLPVDVQALDCDFYAFSGHKMYGPTGIGILYGRRSLLDALPPWQGGGEMIEQVSIETTTYNRLPYKYEAGTPNIADAIGLGAAIDYLARTDWPSRIEHEQSLLTLTLSELRQMPEIRLIGEPARRAGVVSFLVEGSHPHDIGTLLDQQGIAVRTGHHCAMPLMAHLGIPGTVRASFGLYNGERDVERFIRALRKTLSFL
ncbi:MAG: cysteine desulfurase [Pseudomonadales bacterium]|nr:cysteine desulfurase [Pseudomonadales bacterium]